jgi:nickel/cobalt transporter (NicO) family protein
MEFGTLLFAAIQSSFLLGLLHGVNPCGHSWLVLAPFVTGERRGGRVALLTCSFLGGTTLACLALGASLGAISQVVPVFMGMWVDIGTSVVLIVLGALLMYNPQLLHNHGQSHESKHHHRFDQEHHDAKKHSHTHHSKSLTKRLHQLTTDKKLLPFALFGIGFVNMIVPCPTAAVMYGYALGAGSALAASLVFGTYAFSTAIAVGGVILIIFKVTRMASSLQKEWIEPMIMRAAGLVIVLFSIFGIYQAIS